MILRLTSAWFIANQNPIIDFVKKNEQFCFSWNASIANKNKQFFFFVFFLSSNRKMSYTITNTLFRMNDKTETKYVKDAKTTNDEKKKKQKKTFVTFCSIHCR